MSILEKCEQIGKELRKTKEGISAYETYMQLLNSNVEKDFFFQNVYRYYTKYNFSTPQYVIELFQANRNNPELSGWINKEMKNIKAFNELSKANLALFRFVDELCAVSFTFDVFYDYKSTLSITPHLIRLSNSLSVECQRLNIIQKLIKYQNKKELKKIINEHDKLSTNDSSVPFTKQNKAVFNKLKKYNYSKELIEIIHGFTSILSLMKNMIYESFYDMIFEVEISKNEILREKHFGKAHVLVIKKDYPPIHFGWFLKIKNFPPYNYAQIINKTTNILSNKFETKITCVLLNNL